MLCLSCHCQYHYPPRANLTYHLFINPAVMVPLLPSLSLFSFDLPRTPIFLLRRTKARHPRRKRMRNIATDPRRVHKVRKRLHPRQRTSSPHSTSHAPTSRRTHSRRYLLELHTRRGGLALARAMLAAVRLAAYDLNQFAEDGELELELDRVDDAFQRGFDEVQVGEFDGEKGHVHGDDDGVDGEELVHDFSGERVLELRVVGDAEHVSLGALGEPQYAHRFFDVDEREDEFLEEEADHLDLFHDVVALDEVVECAVAKRVCV